MAAPIEATVLLAQSAVLLAQSAGEWKDSTNNLLFMGVFFVALIVVAVWWLRRG